MRQMRLHPIDPLGPAPPPPPPAVMHLPVRNELEPPPPTPASPPLAPLQITTQALSCTFQYEIISGAFAGLKAQPCKPGSRPICLRPGQACKPGACPVEVQAGAGPPTAICRWALGAITQV